MKEFGFKALFYFLVERAKGQLSGGLRGLEDWFSGVSFLHVHFSTKLLPSIGLDCTIAASSLCFLFFSKLESRTRTL